MIGIIGAMDAEMAALIGQMENPRETRVGLDTLVSGALFGREAVLAVCGPGKVNAALCAQSMILRFQPEWLVNIGVAGSADPEVDIGDVVVADAAVQHDMDYGSLGDPRGLISKLNEIEMPCDPGLTDRLLAAAREALPGVRVHRGLIATGDQFVDRAERRQAIREAFPCLAIEMEGGAVAQACRIHGVPFGILRTISDNASARSDMDYPTFKQLAASRSQAVMARLLRA